MKLKRIFIRNIRSFENQELEFPEGSLLLAGDIGTGKTSILLAIEYALFGLQPGQKGSALLRNNCDFGEVSIEIEVDGKNVIMERALKRTNKGISSDYSSITIDGEKTESSTTEIKTKILKLLNYPQEFIKKNNLLYRYTLYTPQEQMKQIILEDSETRLNILRHIFGIDKYKRMRENLNILLNKLKEESRMLNLSLSDLEIDKQELEIRKKSLAQIIKEIQEKQARVSEKIEFRKKIELEVKESESKIKEKTSFEKEVEKTKIMIVTKKESLVLTNNEIKDTQSNISEIKKEFKEEDYQVVLSNLNNIAKEAEMLNKKFIDFLSEINSLEKEKRENLEKKDRVFGMKFCPTCLQDVSVPHKHNILLSTESKLSEIKNKLEIAYNKRKDIELLLEKNKEERLKREEDKLELDILKSRISYIEKSKKRLEELMKVRSSLENDILFLTSHVESLKEAILKFTRFDNLFRIKQEELKKSLYEEKNSEISLAELKKESEFKRREIAQSEEIISKKEISKKKLNNLLELIDWLSNHYLNLIDFIERNIMIKLRTEFSSLFNKWFNMLVPESFEAQLDENFTPLIIQSGIEMDYSFLSGGERTAVALAYRLALNQTINSILSQIKTRDIVILDEPTEGFSELQIDKIRDVLDELDVSQLIIVSHEQKIESFVGNIMRVKKEAGISSVDVEKKIIP
ncbi:AAA family ATPase [Candidatus Pacearchaeota archaeon]|nr:AAA family ATPase [Candidatus Pacearchaeota archaeon]